VVWLDTKPDCVVCKDIYKDKRSDPPCKDCIVEVKTNNEDAVKVFLTCRSQVIRAGMDGQPVAPDIKVVLEIMKLYEVANPKDCFWRVMHLFNFHLEEVFEKAKDEQGKSSIRPKSRR